MGIFYSIEKSHLLWYNTIESSRGEDKRVVWWILGGMFGALLVLIVLLLLTSLYVCIENTEEKPIVITARFLWFRFPTDQKKDKQSGRLGNRAKRLLGVDALPDAGDWKAKLREQPLSDTIHQLTELLHRILNSLFSLLHKGVIRCLRVRAVSAAEDAAAAAIGYGGVCSVVYSLVGYLQSVAHVKKDACQVDVQCRYDISEPSFDYRLVISFRAFWVLCAVLKIILKKDAVK